MTERKLPDDRELEQYLKGDSPLSRRYRDASAGGSPPELDEAILAQARAELKRKPPSLNRYLAPVALAASLLLGVNLAWNLYRVEPVPTETQRLEERRQEPAEPGFVPDAPAPAEPPPAASAPEAKRRKAEAAPMPQLEDRATEADVAAARREREQLAAAQAKEQAKDGAAAEQEKAAASRQAHAEMQRREMTESRAASAPAAPSAALAPEPALLTEAQKVDRLIAYVAALQGATFIRNGEEHTAAEAAKHMQRKRDKAGERCDTAEEFIRTCASFSSMSGEAYLIRFADGRTRTAEDVLREQLAAMESR